jgi:hypothetical protein
MARCTAPVRGHRSAAAAADCPACGGRSGGYGGYTDYSPYPSSSPSSSGSGGGSGSSGSSRSVRPRWSRAGSPVIYTYTQVQSLTPIREAVEIRAVTQPDLRTCSYVMHGMTGRG